MRGDPFFLKIIFSKISTTLRPTRCRESLWFISVSFSMFFCRCKRTKNSRHERQPRGATGYLLPLLVRLPPVAPFLFYKGVARRATILIAAFRPLPLVPGTRAAPWLGLFVTATTLPKERLNMFAHEERTQEFTPST